jgi:hypothetical protein
MGYSYLGQGGALGGGAAQVRTYIALALPVGFVIAVILIALGREKRAIRDELHDEADAGVVTEEEYHLLQSFGARRSAYAKLFFKGDFDAWVALRGLHNRQVQLALAEQRFREETDPQRKAEIQTEVEQIRASTFALRAEFERVLGPSGGRRASAQ